MFGVFTKEKKGSGNQHRYRAVDRNIKLFGCNEGWVPWMLGMAIPSEQGWHVPLKQALARDEVTKYVAEQYPGREANAIVIDVKPGSNELFFCELIDVWGFSESDWTPMLWRLRVLEIMESTKDTPHSFDDFIGADDDYVYEFLYAKGTVKNGKLDGPWLAPKSSPTNGALLWPKALSYFLERIGERSQRGSPCSLSTTFSEKKK